MTSGTPGLPRNFRKEMALYWNWARELDIATVISPLNRLLKLLFVTWYVIADAQRIPFLRH